MTNVIQLRQKNTKKQGDVGLALAWFAEHGHTVCIPLTDSQDYDLVVDFDGKLSRVQVRTTTYKRRNTYSINLKIAGGNKSGTGKIKWFNPQAVDFVFVVTEEGTKYLIPTSEIRSKGVLNLSRKYDHCVV